MSYIQSISKNRTYSDCFIKVNMNVSVITPAYNAENLVLKHTNRLCVKPIPTGSG
jgi:hypothetical protein